MKRVYQCLSLRICVFASYEKELPMNLFYQLLLRHQRRIILQNYTSSVSFGGQTTRILMAEEIIDALKILFTEVK